MGTVDARQQKWRGIRPPLLGLEAKGCGSGLNLGRGQFRARGPMGEGWEASTQTGHHALYYVTPL